jgi:dienelactone hydrolase
VLSIYDRARAFFGPSMPICTMGASAGGHLSLMIAVLRSGVACVDAEAAPTDCLTAQDPIATLCARYFGDADGQASFSPARRAPSIHAPVLLSAATNDTVVYAQQMATMKAALPSANTVLLSPGPAQFVHSTVNASELRRLRNTEKTFMAVATAAWARAHQRPGSAVRAGRPCCRRSRTAVAALSRRAIRPLPGRPVIPI